MSKSFQRKLDNILSAMSGEYGEWVSEKFIENLERKSLLLQDNPRLYVSANDSVLEEVGFREFHVNKNTIYYLVDDEKEEILLMSIFNEKQGRQSIRTELFRNKSSVRNESLDDWYEEQEEEPVLHRKIHM